MGTGQHGACEVNLPDVQLCFERNPTKRTPLMLELIVRVLEITTVFWQWAGNESRALAGVRRFVWQSTNLCSCRLLR